MDNHAPSLDPRSAERVRALLVQPLDCPPEALRVVAAACLLDRAIHAMPPPSRHHNIIHELSGKGLDRGEQGFLLNNGRFVSRRAAAQVALRSGQVTEVAHPGHGLYSEDLW